MVHADALLPTAPSSIEDANGNPLFGTYQGNVDAVQLSRLRGPYALGFPFRLLKHKRWQYAMVVTPEVLAVFSIADLGYTANAFACAVDLEQQVVLFDASFMGLPNPFTRVGNQPAEGARSRFRSLNARFSIHRGIGQERYYVHVVVGKEFNWDGDILASGSAPALTVIAPVAGDGIVNVTQKWAGLVAAGSLRAGGRSYPLAGGVAGLDYTQGYLARRTAWRWAFANGRLSDGISLGFNLVEGFNESDGQANENALWLGHRLVPLGRARFEFDRSDVLRPWHVTTVDRAVDLTFSPIHVHREERDYRVVKSHFVQPLGFFEGTLRVDGQVLHMSRLAGVVEDQDILW